MHCAAGVLYWDYFPNHDIISLNILKNGVTGDAVIAFPKLMLYLCAEKDYKIRDHTPDFYVKFRSKLSNFMD